MSGNANRRRFIQRANRFRLTNYLISSMYTSREGL